MKSVMVEQLSLEKFSPFGSYANMINPNAEKFGFPPREFYRDMLQQNIGRESIVSYSITRVEPRDLIINMSEYHSYTAEGLLPLDNDILIHVAPATRPNSDFPFDKVRVFRVPKGTLVIIRPGVWHHAPFIINNDHVNILIMLPERTYENDCHLIEIAKAGGTKIDE